jgi:hypothetical protein
LCPHAKPPSAEIRQCAGLFRLAKGGFQRLRFEQARGGDRFRIALDSATSRKTQPEKGSLTDSVFPITFFPSFFLVELREIV